KHRTVALAAFFQLFGGIELRAAVAPERHRNEGHGAERQRHQDEPEMVHDFETSSSRSNSCRLARSSWLRVSSEPPFAGCWVSMRRATTKPRARSTSGPNQSSAVTRFSGGRYRMKSP